MTTIACNLREIAGDTRCVWEGAGTDAYRSLKIYEGPKALYGVHGSNCDGVISAIQWLKDGAPKLERPVPPEEAEWDWKIIELTDAGIALYNTLCERDLCLEPMLAIGSGAKVAMYCMKFLKMSPAQAVAEAAKVDDWTDVPVYSAALVDRKIQRWSPPKKRRGR